MTSMGAGHLSALPHAHGPLGYGLPRTTTCGGRNSVLCYAHRSQPEDGDVLRFTNVCQGAVAALVVSNIIFNARAARAFDDTDDWEHIIWRPRRHHTHIGERYTSDWAQKLVEIEESDLERTREYQRLLEAEQRRAEEEALLAARRRAEEEMNRKRERHRVEYPAGPSFLTQVQEYAGVYGWLVVLGGAYYLYSSRLLQRLFGGQQGSGGGRWVYDRSLGGKKVWVPDNAPGYSPTPTIGVSVSPGIKEDDFDRLAAFAAAARTAPTSQTSSVFQLPQWWDPPPVVYVALDSKEERTTEAQRVLTRLEQAKNRGQDYELSDILKLRRICQSANISVQPKTVGGKEAIFRVVVEAAISSAMDPGTIDLDDQRPTRLVTAVAQDLSLADERAVEIVTGQVAAAARLRLVDAVTKVKAQDQLEAMLALTRLAGLLSQLPVLQLDSPAIELIYSSLADRSSAEERSTILRLFMDVSPETATLVAAMLGFDPNTVGQEGQNQVL